MRREIRRRMIAAMLGTSVLAGVALVPSAQLTEAAWTDAERATATASAIDVPEPISSGTPGCVTSSGLLGANPTVTINWRVPAGVTDHSLTTAEFGYTLNANPIAPIPANLMGNVQTTGTTTAYVTVISGGLLSGLLGASATFAVRFTGSGGWKSNWLVANASMGLLGANPQCASTVAPSY